MGIMQENQFLEDLHSQEDSASSSSSSTITDLLEDDASSPSPPTSPTSPSSMDGPLHQLSELITELPIKKGLSKFYGGKSQSFTSLASVKSVEDLPKKENPYNVRMKICRSYADGLDGYQNQQNSPRFCGPKHTISKRMSSRGSFLSTMVVVGRNIDMLSTCNRPPISIQK